MKTGGIRGTLVVLCLAAITIAENSGPPVADVEISSSFLEQFQMTGRKTQPFYKNGRLMHPDISLLVKPKIVNGADGAQAVLDVDINGWSTTHSSRRVIFGNTVNVTVASEIDADYGQELKLTPDGLKDGRLTGTPRITPHISTSNTFRKPRRARKAAGIALSTASGMVQAQLPEERADLDEEIRNGVRTGVEQAKAMVGRTLSQANALVANAKDFPFESSMSSKGGDRGSLSYRLTDKGGAKPRNQPPKLAQGDQAATTVTIHGDLLSDTIGAEIAGQEMFLADFKKKLCGPKTERLLDFCKKEMPEDVAKYSIVFDKEKPIEFFFDKGKIGIRLNAVYRQSTEEALAEKRDLLNPPDREGISFETVPYSVDITYKMNGTEAVLDDVTVRDRVPPTQAPDLLKAAASFFLPPDHEKSDKENREELAKNLSPAIRIQLRSKLKEAMKDKITFPTVSFPTQLETPKFGGGQGDPKVTGAGSLIPLEVKAQDGWLVVGNSFCSDGMPSLGVTMVQRDYVSHGARLWALQAFGITPGSPAERMGLKVGDVVEGFGVPGERSTTVINGARDPFYAFLGERAKEKSPAGRTIEITGRSVKGEPFKKTVTLCPSGMDHKAEAAKTVQAVREAGK